LRGLLRALAVVTPRLRLKPGDLAGISRHQAAMRAYVADPRFQPPTTPGLAAELFTAMRETQAAAASLRLPLLILHGEADRMASPTA
jgi:alpha-beta hydrolase superfamily lysophospholipase